MVASSIFIAALQRVLHADGQPRFLIKGGAYIELRLGLSSRATKDIDAIFRGSFDGYLQTLDEALSVPFDGITFLRKEPKTIEVPGLVEKPRRIEVVLRFQGRTWRRVTLEISGDEGIAKGAVDTFHTPSLAHFGFSTPITTAGLAMNYQVAQKIHACTDPKTSSHPNDRVRDVVDLHLLKAAFYPEGSDLNALLEACQEVFSTRAKDAEATAGMQPRPWPPLVVVQPTWDSDYPKYTAEVGLGLTLAAAVALLNDWINNIGRS